MVRCKVSPHLVHPLTHIAQVIEHRAALLGSGSDHHQRGLSVEHGLSMPREPHQRGTKLRPSETANPLQHWPLNRLKTTCLPASTI